MTRTQSDSMQTQPVAIAQADDASARRHAWYRALAILVVAFFTLLFCGNLFGQQATYDVIRLPDAEEQEFATKLKDIQRYANSYVRSREPQKFRESSPANYELVKRYYTRYIPVKMTQPEALPQMNELVQSARDAVLRSVRSKSPTQREVLGWLYNSMKKVANGNYHPPARINAVQFLANIDTSGSNVPRPNPIVLKELLPIYKDQNNPEAVRAAALQGLERFIRYTPASRIPANAKPMVDDLKSQMEAMLSEKAPVGRDELVHAYLQRYAVNILTSLSTDATPAKTFVSVSVNEENPNLIALHSAAAIGTLPKNLPPGEVENGEVLKQWATRILAEFESEAARLNALSKKDERRVRQPASPEGFLKSTTVEEATPAPGMDSMYGGDMMMMDESMYEGMDSAMEMEMEMGMEMGMGMGMGMMGMGMASTAKPQPPEIVASKKQLNFVLQQILLGVTGSPKPAEDITTFQAKGGLLASTKPDTVAEVHEWLTTINEVVTQLNDETLDTRIKYVKVLEEQVDVLKELIKSGADAGGKGPVDGPDVFDPLAADIFKPEPRRAAAPAGDPLDSLAN